MNKIIKSIITNPYAIGGTGIGLGLIGGTMIWAKKRPKTDAEIDLEKLKEQNAEKTREREHQIEMEKIKNRQILDEIEAQEQTKRDAKKQEERTKQLELEIQKLKEQREWEKTAPNGYWELEIAKANAAGAEATAKKEADLQRDIARLQAESAKYTADRNAQAVKDREHYDYLRTESRNNAEAAKMGAIVSGIGTLVSGKNN